MALDPDNKMNHIYKACCMFYMGMYQEAEEEVAKGTSLILKVFLPFL